MSADLSDLYQNVILDHNRRPRNRGRIPTANRSAHGDNPSCGDQCDVFLRLDGDRIAEISFDGSGCAISQASASLMTTQLKGKTTAEAEKLYKDFHEIVTTGKEPEEISDLGAFAGVHSFPARIKCATLSWHAALNAIKGDAAAAVHRILSRLRREQGRDVPAVAAPGEGIDTMILLDRTVDMVTPMCTQVGAGGSEGWWRAVWR